MIINIYKPQIIGNVDVAEFASLQMMELTELTIDRFSYVILPLLIIFNIRKQISDVWSLHL